MARANLQERARKSRDLHHREEPKPSHKGVQSWVGTVDGSSGSQEQEAAPQGRDEVMTITGTGWSCEAVTCGLLVGTLGASGTEQACLRVKTCGHLAGATGTSGTKSSRLSMEHPGAAGSCEVKTCRGGDVVEAGAEMILNNVSNWPVLIPTGVGRVTPWSLAGVVDAWVMSQWKSWAGRWETSCGHII